jgi:hypothetical protein
MERVLLASVASLLIACNPIQESHIRDNVPDAANFDRFLQRDLTAYFSGANVTFELLRREPTQSGVAYPKFYAGVRAVASGAPPVEGAVRIAAENREKFVVTDFLSAQEIRANPDQVYAIFPAALCPEIKRRAFASGPLAVQPSSRRRYVGAATPSRSLARIALSASA